MWGCTRLYICDIHMCRCTCVQMWRRPSGIYMYCSLTYFVRQGLSLNLNIAILATMVGQLTRGIQLPLHLCVYRIYCNVRLFMWILLSKFRFSHSLASFSQWAISPAAPICISKVNNSLSSIFQLKCYPIVSLPSFSWHGKTSAISTSSPFWPCLSWSYS